MKLPVTCPLIVALCALTPLPAPAQNAAPGTLPARMTGGWTLNKELSPSLAPSPGGTRGGRRGGGALFAVAGAGVQRGGRGGGGGGGASADASPLMAEEVAAQAALDVLHQVPLEIAIAATEGEIRFTEPRGEWLFKTDGKTSRMQVPGGTITVKSKWERQTLRQEFSSSQRKLVKIWTVDASDRLSVTERIESLTFNTKDSTAIFDRQQRPSAN